MSASNGRTSAESKRAAWAASLGSGNEGIDGPALRGLLEREFPSMLPQYDDAVGRRDFLQLMGASLALAGLGSCTRQPDEKILSYAKSPEDNLPGKPLRFATAMPLGGAALGLLVESHEGRPVKVEGNPDHPSSLGATDGFAQAATLALYDPDRSRVVLNAGEIRTWADFHQALRDQLGREDESGRGVRILTPVLSSPSAAAEMRALLESWPEARWVQWEPVNADAALRASMRCFGRPLTTRYAFERADVVLSLDADFLASGPGGVRYAREFSQRRKARADGHSMNRLYAVESSVSATGAFADHRLAIKPSGVEHFARRLAAELGAEIDAGTSLPAEQERLVRALARDLREHVGAGVVIAGTAASEEVHALAHWMNRALGNVGETVSYTESITPAPEECAPAMVELCDEMRRGEVRALMVLGGNPVYDAPADCGFLEAYGQVPFRVHLSLYEDETSLRSHWHLPQAHFLESWGDARGHDGTLTPIQPLIAPLYDGRSLLEVTADLAGRPMARGHELLRERWRALLGLDDDAAFEDAWQRALHDGLVADSAFEAVDPGWDGALELGPAPAGGGLEVAFRADSSVYDGRFANVAWLQESPRVITRLVWDTVALMSPAMAAELGIGEDEVVRLSVGERTVEAPVWVTPGHPEGSVTALLGGGRTAGGKLAEGVGFDAYPLRGSAGLLAAQGVELTRTDRRHLLVSVQDHRRMEGRDILRVRDISRFDEPAGAHAAHGAGDGSHAATDATAEHGAPEAGHGAPQSGHGSGEVSMYPPRESEGYAWGMVIDLNGCIGCNACMLACQSENNVPVVGKDQVAVGREMHWLRIDQYLEGPAAAPVVSHQPVPCMHCELASCELVCPVGATVHGEEGLNEMVYNRCVGTRYCSNNCPYKVRRFNFFHYSKQEDPVESLGMNPDVTVRTRGVMEKCTYCVQRINRARIDAKLEDRAIRDGELQSACQQVCPTQAIVFGDINDDDSEVSHLREEPQHYALLAELGTRPRTTYLEKFRNLNPELGPTTPDAEGGTER